MRDNDNASERELQELREALNTLHLSALQLQRAAKRLEQVKDCREGTATPETAPRLLVGRNGCLISRMS